jgi:class 3 adenylate cyclase/tetratricopeptide (TPR) repeat protein
MNCPTCGTENREGARFCRECATALALACPACGAPHEAGQRFCDACGTALTGASAAAPAAAAPSVAAELRVVSVLFVDLVGYTTLAESRDAEDARELLSRYFDTARTIVGRYGGEIEKFIGDAVMAVWGAPVAREDDAERAVRAGLDLVDAVTAFGEEVSAPELRARAGVVTGQVASVAQPGEGLVVGDRVNTASRVQSTAEPGTVLVDEVTRQASSAAITYADAGEHAVKGKAEPLRLWRAERVVAGVGGSQRQQGLVAPFVGRDSELRLVKDLFHAGVDRGTARLVAISGAPGVGKSRLLQEFENYVDGLVHRIRWHSGRCLSYGEGVAYWALAQMVRQRLGIPEDAGPEEADRRLALWLDQWIADPAERAFLTPRVGALLGTAEGGLDRQDLFAGWRLFFERISEQAPAVLVFEDLHWADAGLLEFIEHLLSWSARRPIFVLTLARPELAERRPGWAAGGPGVTPLFLEPLGDGAIGELLDGLVDGLPAAARSRIVAQAEGVPLFALETVRALTDRGALVASRGRLRSVGNPGELEVPATLSSLLTARLDALTPEERALLKDVAVLGGSFPRTVAAALSALPDEQVDGLLATLVAKQVLVVRADPLSPDKGQYAFAQSLLRTVAYEMLSRRERKSRHLAAAEHLRASFPNDGEEVAEAIAAHYVDAFRAARGDPEEEELRSAAIAALRRGAQRAASVGAPQAAEHAYRTATTLARDDAERGDLARHAGLMANRAARYEPALELFATARESFTAAGLDRDATVLAVREGQALRRLGRVEEAVELLRRALAAVGSEEMSPDVAAITVELGTSLTFAGHSNEARGVLDHGIAMAEAFQQTGLLCEALVSSGNLAQDQGRFEYARLLLEGALKLAQRNGFALEAARAATNLGNLLMACDLADARPALDAALATSRRLGIRAQEEITLDNLLQHNLLAGRWAEMDAIADERPGLRDWPDVAFPMLLLAVQRADGAEARRCMELIEVWSDSESYDEPVMRNVGVAALALFEGRDELALDAATTAIDGSPGLSTEGPRYGLPIAVDAALRLGRPDELEALVERLASQPIGLQPPLLRAQLARARGLLAAARGESAGVEEPLRHAITAFGALGYSYWHAVAQGELASWLAEQGRAEEAEPLRLDATDTLDRLGARVARSDASSARI